MLLLSFSLFIGKSVLVLCQKEYSQPAIQTAYINSSIIPQIEGDWTVAYWKAANALTQLDNTGKVRIVTGIGWQNGPCVGNTGAAPSIGLPSLCLQDGPLGLRFARNVTAFPPAIQAGSTWNRKLLRTRGKAIGEEARALGVHVVLGPSGGPLGKIAHGGRNWEGFGADPYLTGVGMSESIIGLQSVGVQACAKHVIANEQELNRRTMSSNVDDRTLHELYMWPFADAVHANVAAIMCSYNRVNGSWACESEPVMVGLVKEGLDFPGYILSDWDSQRTTIGSANAGLDMSMPGNSFDDPEYFFWGENLLQAVPEQVPQARLDDMVLRILASWYHLGQDTGYPPTTISSWDKNNHDVQSDHKEIARTVAREGTVLLKNDGDALPLRSPVSLAVIGKDAITNPDGPNACEDRGCNNGTLGMGWGSGAVDYPYLISPLDAIRAQAKDDGTQVVTSTTNSLEEGAEAAAAAETAIVCINANSGEGYITVDGVAGDRPNLNPWYFGNELVEAVAAVNRKTIVVIHSVGPIILERVLAQENVIAVVWAGLPGQESGNALVDILYGLYSPSGKLPYTIAKYESDYPAMVVPADDNYSEGLYVDYRHFDKYNIEPRYEFGYGLSYTTFAYSDLDIQFLTRERNGSGSTDPFDAIAIVTAKIANSGNTTGAEVAQLYVSLPSNLPPTPARQLRGFAKTKSLEPGTSEKVSIEIRRKDVSYWDVEKQEFVMPAGETIGIMVGASSRKARLEGELSL